MYVRRNVWELGGDWADPILWYARGVAELRSRAIAEPTSWSFYGAIHGIYAPLWEHYGYLDPAAPLPSQALIDQYWTQCQHGSWYFLPWHRGYLLAFEAVVRDAVTGLGGPEEWALPYWNYFKPNQFKLPPAFASRDWPDGNDNPLFVPPRWGPNNDGDVYIPLSAVNLNAMNDPDFTGVANGGSPGFGGVDTGFEHGGRVHGGLETQPHDWVHGLVGGGDPDDPNMPGLMSDPDTAALDPIFWLHHANIDRLWEVWRNNPPTHVDPAEAKWLGGPASIGERPFEMPMPGGANLTYTPAEMADLATLGYQYDDIEVPAGAPAPEQRLVVLGVAPQAAANAARGMAPMVQQANVEMVGANEGPLAVRGRGVDTSIALEPEPTNKVRMSLDEAPDTSAPDRVFLNLENVRGTADATALQVYVGLAAGANPANHPENLAGSVSLFGVRKASRRDGEQAGSGLTYVLDISRIVDALHLSSALDSNELKVSIVPVRPIPEQTQVSVGRVSVYRQGQ